jgi:hypothetical protein
VKAAESSILLAVAPSSQSKKEDKRKENKNERVYLLLGILQIHHLLQEFLIYLKPVLSLKSKMKGTLTLYAYVLWGSADMIDILS